MAIDMFLAAENHWYFEIIKFNTYTVFENHRKSLIQQYEQSELG